MPLSEMKTGETQLSHQNVGLRYKLKLNNYFLLKV